MQEIESVFHNGLEGSQTSALQKAQETRTIWANGDDVRDRNVIDPETIVCVKDIDYVGEKNPMQFMDIYYPATCPKRAYPVIVSIHGGGWFYGDKERYSHYTKLLASKGFAVVNFNYRLAPEVPYPAGFQDVCQVMDFLITHAETYQLDLSHLFMVGDSCGAQLVSQYCIYADSEAYQNCFPFTVEHKILPKAVALNCGVYDMTLWKNEQNFMYEWYTAQSEQDLVEKSLHNYMDYMTEHFPETYLMCSVNDELRVHTPILRQKLEALGIAHQYVSYGQDCVEDSHVFHLNLHSENGKRCNEAEIEFFKGKL